VICITTLNEWVAKVNQARDFVVIVEGRNDADALRSRGVDQPFFITLDPKMKVFNDSLDATFAVMKIQNHVRRSVVLTDFDKEGEKHHARIKNAIVSQIEVDDLLRYELKKIIRSDEIEMIWDYGSSYESSKVFYQLSNLPPRKYLLLLVLKKRGSSTIGESNSALRKMGLKIHRDKVRTDLRNLVRDGLATYDPNTNRFALSENGYSRLTRPLLEIRSRKLGTRL